MANTARKLRRKLAKEKHLLRPRYRNDPDLPPIYPPHLQKYVRYTREELEAEKFNHVRDLMGVWYEESLFVALLNITLLGISGHVLSETASITNIVVVYGAIAEVFLWHRQFYQTMVEVYDELISTL